jgi:hypothetical protein
MRWCKIVPAAVVFCILLAGGRCIEGQDAPGTSAPPAPGGAAGGGWRMPTVPELKALYQKGAAPDNMDPLFQTTGVWVWSGQLRNAWSAWGFAFYNGLEGWQSLDYGYGRLAFAVRSQR